MKRAAFYLRVSQDSQTTENQLRLLQEVAERSGWDVVAIFEDHGISGAKGRDKRPGYDALLKAISRREIDIVAAWSVDRLGRSLSDLVAFLSDIQAKGCDLYLHQQAVDTSTPSGRALFLLSGVFAELEKSIITARVNAGLARARANGVQFGRPNLSLERRTKVQKALTNGLSIRQTAKATGVSTASVQRIKRSMSTVQETVLETVAA
jgi:DNA invertase Pin-like site-specific DNA recombinase